MIVSLLNLDRTMWARAGASLLLGLVLIGMSAIPAAAQQDLFEQFPPGFTGIAGGSTSIGDVDNDGDLDVVIVGGPATLYLGDGQGDFTEANAELTKGSSSSFGDVNNDGNLDLLIAGGDQTTLYLGDGQGGFTEAEAGLINVPSYASTSIADVNGDGNLDLLITGYDFSDLSATLYLGNGDGSFEEAEAGLTGVTDGSTSIADFDNDGHLDLLITGSTETGSSPDLATKLYLGDGQGGFTEAGAGLTDVTNGHFSVGDINEDSNLDLLITGEKENAESTTTLYLGDGQGSFTEADAGLKEVKNSSSSIADLDGDGNLDILIAGNKGNDFNPDPIATLYLGDGEGGFTKADSNLDGTVEATTAVGDLVGDDSLDLLITGSKQDGNPYATLYEGDGQGGFETVGPNLKSVSSGSASFGDVNADGNLDLLLTGETENDESDPVTTLYLGNGQGAFTVADAGLSGVSGGSSSIGDVNNDGNLDLVITGLAVVDNEADVYLGDGQGGFTRANAGLSGVVGGSSSIGDVNNDGNPDLIITGLDNDSEDSATLYLGDGQGEFSEANAEITGVRQSASEFGDVNNDGNLDLVITGINGADGSTTLYLGNGQGGFNETSAGLEDFGGGDLFSRGSISVGDVDNDENLDLLLTGESEGFASDDTILYLGDGQGGFDKTFAGPSVGGKSSSSIGDVNDDGNLDLLIGDETSTHLYLGDGEGNFTESDTELTSLEEPSSALGDVDNDGHLDLVMTGEPSSDVFASLLYENLSSGTLLSTSVSRTVSGDGGIDFGETGVGVSFSGTSGSGEVTVQRYSNTPNNPRGISETNVSEYRLVISAAGDLSFDADTEVRLNMSTLGGISEASNVTVYKRSPRGAGLFSEVPTSYDSGGNELVATTGSFSEFVLASDSEPLPVEFAGLSATVNGDEIELSWATASETNNASFRIQRRGAAETGGRGEWKTIGRKQGAGTTTEAQSYRFTDADLPYEADALSYRLKQVDSDGTAHFSDEVVVERGVTKVELLGTYPNPAQQRTTVRYALPEKQNATIRLYDVLGRQVQTVVSGKKEGRHEQRLDLSSLSSGVYFLRLEAGETVRTQKLTITK